MFKKGMIRFRRKMAAVLAAAMLFSSYPVPAYAAGDPDGVQKYADTTDVQDAREADGLVSGDEADVVSEDEAVSVSVGDADSASKNDAVNAETAADDIPADGDETPVVVTDEVVPVGNAPGNKTWDFSNNESYNISGEPVSINGLIVDPTNGNLIKNSWDPYAEFNGGAKLYVPVYDNSVVRITGALSEQYSSYIKINGEVVTFTGEITRECVSGKEKAGYVSIESIGTSRSDYKNYIKKLEIMDAHTLSFNALGQNVGSAVFGNRYWYDDKTTAEAVEAAVNAAPAGKVFAGWSETEDGQAFDFNTDITENKTFYAIYEDAPAGTGELCFSDIKNLTDEGKLKYRFATVNGFTIYDKTDSQNSIIIWERDSTSTLIASATKASTDTCMICGNNVAFTDFNEQECVISFKPTVDSEVLVVAEHTNPNNGNNKNYVHCCGKNYSLQFINSPTLVINEAKAGELCTVFVDKDILIHYIKVVPKSKRTSWDFTVEKPFGLIGNEIDGTRAYIDGLFIDTVGIKYNDGEWLRGINDRGRNTIIRNYCNDDDPTKNCINLEQGAVIYVPVNGHECMRINVSNGYQNVLVNGVALTAGISVVACNALYPDYSYGEPVYLKIEAANGPADLKNIELVDISGRVSFKVSGETIKSSTVYDGNKYDVNLLTEAEGIAIESAPSGKFFAWWSETEDGEAFDLSTPVMTDKILYAVYKDINEGELFFSGISDLIHTYQAGEYIFNSETINYNGFTLHVNSDSMNYVKIKKDTAIQSTAGAATSMSIPDIYSNAYMVNDGIFFSSISFETAEDSTVAMLAQTVTNNNKIIIQDSTGRRELYKMLGNSKPSVVLFDMKANDTCCLSLDTGTRIYWIKVIPKSQTLSWDFTSDACLGELGDEVVTNSPVYVDGMYVKGTLKEYSEESERLKKGISIKSGTSVYIPFHEGSLIKIIAPNGYENIRVNNESLTAAESYLHSTESSMDGYVEICTTGDADLKKIEIIDDPVSVTVSFNVVNGSWDEGEDAEATAEKSVILAASRGSIMKLNADQIPAVGSKPDEGYKAGSWDVTPDTDTAITGNITYTYTYAQKTAANIITAPKALTLSYNGLSQALVSGGVAESGVMEYSLNGTDYSTTIPTGKNAGKYTVYYRAGASAEYLAGTVNSLTVNIAKTGLTVTAKPNTITYGDMPSGNGVTYSGFVNNETSAVLGGTLAYDFTYSQYGNVGSYTITPKGLTSGNYNITFVPGTLTVDKKEAGLTWTDTSLTFNGSAQAPIATATGTVNNDAINVTVSGAKTNAGTGYTATATALTGSKAGNYKLPSSVTKTFSISKAAAQTIADVKNSSVYTASSVTGSVTGKMPADAGTLSYTAGTASVAKVSGSTIIVSSFMVNNSGAVSAVIANGKAGDVITLPVTISSTNYADSTVNVVITLEDKQTTTVTITGGNSITKTYDDADFTIDATVPSTAGNGSFTYSSSNADVANVDATGKVSIKKSGNTTITVTFESDTHKGSEEIILTVNKKAITGATATLGSVLTYNGSEQTKTVSKVELSGKDILAYCDISGNKKKDAGTYTLTITAKEDSDYTGSITSSFTIASKSVIISGITAADKTYDGTVTATASGTAVIEGKVNADSLSITAGNAKFADADAGTNKTVTFTGYALAGSASGNYVLSSQPASVTAAINARPITIKASDQSVDLNGTIVAGTTKISVTSGSLVSGHSISDITLTPSDTSHAGNGTITPGAAKILNGTADVTANYAVTYENGTLTVNKAKAVVSAAPVKADSLKYNGTSQVLLSSGGVAVTGVEYSLDGTAYSDTIPAGKDAGSYTVYYRAKADDDHTVGDAAELKVSIAKADAVVKANDASKNYGSADPAFTALVIGTFGSDTLSYTISRVRGEDAGTYAITPAGDAEQGNYNVSFEAGTFTINVLAITPSVILSQNSYVYDGTEKKPAVTVKNGSSVIASSAYTVKYVNNINAGTADVTVTAKNGGNYSFDVTVHFTIEKAPITPVVAMADFAQGSTASTPVVTGNPGNGTVTFLYKVKGAADNTYTDTMPSTEGSYTVSANIAETDNYLGGYATDDFNITKTVAAVTTAPSANILSYNGSARELVSAGTAAGGTLKYAKGSSKAPSESFNEAIPTGTNAGVYYVWYKAFGDKDHTDSTMGSVMVIINKAAQAAPAAPALKSVSLNSITLVSHEGYEYKCGEGSWQSSASFNGLEADTEYTFYQRISGDENHEASPASEGAKFKTDAPAPTPTEEDKPTPTVSDNEPTPTVSDNTPTPTVSDNTPTPTVTVTPTPTEVPSPTLGPTPTPIPVHEEPAEMKFVFANGTNEFSAEYTGSAIKPEILGYCGSRLLAEGKDYTVSYSRNTAAGTAKVSIIGRNGYEGKYSLEFTIAPKRIDDNGAPAEGIIVSGLTVQGDAAVKPVLTYNGVKLGTDKYSVTTGRASDDTETVTITAKNKNYTGEIKDLPVTRIKDKKEFEKTAIKVELAKVSRVYDGTPKLLGSELRVTDQEGNLLYEGPDYEVSYSSDVINAGKVKAQIIGIGNYTGSVKISYKIEPAKKAAIEVKLIPENDMPEGTYSYSKNKVTPSVFVTASVSGNTNVLAEGIDYTVKYSKNSKPGTTGTIKLTFKGNYKGAKTEKINFTIEKAGFKDAEIYVSDLQYAKPGDYMAKPVIMVNGEVVAKNQYTLSYSINGDTMPAKFSLKEDEAEALITVTATSRNKGFKENDTISATYRVYRDGKTDVSKAKVTLVEKDGTKKISKLGYTGNPITFSPDNKYRQADIQVKIGDTKLVGEEVFKYFDVTYADNVEKGKATMILTAKEGSTYSGMCSGSFKIVKRKVK